MIHSRAGLSISFNSVNCELTSRTAQQWDRHRIPAAPSRHPWLSRTEIAVAIYLRLSARTQRQLFSLLGQIPVISNQPGTTDLQYSDASVDRKARTAQIYSHLPKHCTRLICYFVSRCFAAAGFRSVMASTTCLSATVPAGLCRPGVAPGTSQA